MTPKRTTGELARIGPGPFTIFRVLPADEQIRDRLDNLKALTDTSLTHLSVDDLLDELLARVRDILNAATAAVLLLDESSSELVARAAAGVLERSLMPGALPRCVGLELAAHYVPAEGRTVGGDWYDLFTLPSSHVWIVVGDIAGHGLRAAVVLGRIRSALQSYMLVEEHPERVLEFVDRKVNHFETGTIATVACAVTEPPFDTITVALAGHPPPAVAAPGRPTELAVIQPGPPLGTGLKVRRRSAKNLPLAPGTVLAFYTDGLVERRAETIDAGFERLRAAMSPSRPDQVAREVMHRLVADAAPEDDIVLLIVRRTDD
jgi:serine phosphatase RsbU (regulator of sigma subunit)